MSPPRPSNSTLPATTLKQVAYILSTQKFEPLVDLAFSLIGYNIFAHTVYLGLVLITWYLFDHPGALPDSRKDIINFITLSLWTLRFLLRFRRHLLCVFYWFWPLSPEPFDACLYCWRAVDGEGEESESETDEGERR